MYSKYSHPLLISTGFLKYPLELKKKSVRTLEKFQLVYTDFLSQFEMNAKMDISKNQWRSTGGMGLCSMYLLHLGKGYTKQEMCWLYPCIHNAN